MWLPHECHLIPHGLPGMGTGLMGSFAHPKRTMVKPAASSLFICATLSSHPKDLPIGPEIMARRLVS